MVWGWCCKGREEVLICIVARRQCRIRIQHGGPLTLLTFLTLLINKPYFVFLDTRER